MAGSLKHLVFLGKYTGNLHILRITTVIVNYYAVVLVVRQGPLGREISNLRRARRGRPFPLRAVGSPCRAISSTYGGICSSLNCLIVGQGLRLDWPATEWKTGLESNMAGKMAGSQFWGGPKMAKK